MQLYSIMPLQDDHVEEICRDIKEQYETGISNCALFIMKLVPEGDPVIDKAAIFCEKYDKFRDRLARDGIECGILVQCSIGHGGALNVRSPYQYYVRMNSGDTDNIVCPYDEGFREYIKKAMATLASHSPKVIMLDDDFRLMGVRRGVACACPRHLKEISDRAGKNITREELYDAVMSKDKRLTEILVETQIEALVGAARAMREGIDSVDSTIPGIFCCVGNACEGATEIATIMAGKGNPVTVRINNGRYTKNGTHELSSVSYRAAIQAAVLKGAGHIDTLLAETDTCPQNRYSTSAMSLHAHFTTTILEGIAGAKHWITRTLDYEPESGKRYRQVLSKFSGFYNALSNLAPTLSWVGCKLPLSSVPDYALTGNNENHTWVSKVLERLGLPVYFSSQEGGAAFLAGNSDLLFSDTDITKILSGTVFLAGETAYNLCRRGFSPLLGVDVRPWNGKNISGEMLHINNKRVRAQVRTHEIVPISDGVREESVMFHIPDGKTRQYLFPGVTWYENELGGRVVVFSGTPDTEFNYIEAFSLLNQSRKEQMIDLLSRSGNLPIYYPGDCEIYLRAAYMPDGGMFAAVFNLSPDTEENISLVCEKIPSRVMTLMPDGTSREVEFSCNGKLVTINKSAQILDPVVLLLY